MMHIDDLTRQKILRVWDGHGDINAILTPLHFVYLHMQHAKLHYSLDWLIRNNLRGQQFIDFFKEKCKESNLEFQRFLLSKIEKENKLHLIAGKDVIV